MILDFGELKMKVLFLIFTLLLFGRMAHAQCTGTITSTGAVTICASATGPTITVATPTAGVSYQLKRTVGGTTSNVGAAKSGTSALNWTNNNTAGTYTVVATKSTAPTCSATLTGSVVVTVNPKPSTPTIAGVSICRGSSATLTGTAGANGTTLKWYDVTSGGTALATALNYTTVALTANKNYYVSSYNATTLCEGSRTTVTVTVNPGAPSVAGVSICSGGTATLSGTAGVNATTLRWYAASSGGTPLATALTYTTVALTSNRNYYVSSYNATTLCESARATVAVTVNPVPSTPTVSGIAVCSGNTATLSGTVGANGTTLKWYNSTGVTLLATATSFTTTALTANTSYRVSSFNATTLCESAKSTVTVTINSLPAAPTLSLVGSGSLSQQSIAMGSTTTGVNYTLYLNDQTTGRTTAGNGQPYSWTSLTADGAYYVLAANAQTCTRQSNIINIVNGLVSDQVEYQALKDIFISTNGANWTNKTNWPTTWPATATATEFQYWFGCSMVNGDINSLDFSSNNLSGPLPSSIGDLRALVFLNFYNNKLTSMPSTLNQLTELDQLWLSNNNLTGDIPNLSNLTKLSQFDASENVSLNAAPVPAWLNAPNITNFGLRSTNRVGSFPNFDNAANLFYIDLTGNALTGPLPAFAPGTLANLKYLFLQSNQISSIPAEIGNLTKLESLRLDNNLLSGPIPARIGDLINLNELILSTNQLSGTIPSTIGNLTNLYYLGLFDNALTGTIPSEIGGLANIRYLYLYNNQLSGEIPSSVGNLTTLAYFRVENNKLTGPLPDLSRLPLLAQIIAYNNQLSGSVLTSHFSNAMIDFQIAGNQFSGTLPDINHWPNISAYLVGGNQFTGPFPSFDPALFPNLFYINANSNKLTSIPVDVLNTRSYYYGFADNLITEIRGLASAISANSLHPDITNVIPLENNLLDFSQLEALKGLGVPGLTYNPQKPISDLAPITFNTNTPSLIIPSRATGQYSTVVWEKQQNDGTWLDINALNQDATQSTFTKSNPTAADEGIYRWTMTNSLVTGMTLSSGSIIVNTQTRQSVDTWAFQYKYDGRKRMTHKKVPGAEWVYMVYDDRDRLVLTQDGNQRKTNQWMFTKYDALNRPVMTGLYTDNTYIGQEAMQNILNTIYTTPEAYGVGWYETFVGNTPGNVHGYDNHSCPNANYETLTVTYYDDYGFKSLLNDPENEYKPNQVSPVTSLTGTYSQAANENLLVKGQVTGSKVKVLGQGNYLLNVTYYDDKYRAIQTVSDNNLGGKDRTTNVVDFVGKVLATKTDHSISKLDWIGPAYYTYLGSSVITGDIGGMGETAHSVQKLSGGGDGWIQFTQKDLENQKIIEISPGNGFIITNNVYSVNSAGSSVNSGYGAFGNAYRIARTGGLLSFYVNGKNVYTATSPSTEELSVNVTFNKYASIPASVDDIATSFSQQQTSTTRTFEYDHAGRLLKTWHQVGNPDATIHWKDLVNVTATGNTLTKTGGIGEWDAGAASVETLPANADGWAEFTVTSAPYQMLGFSAANADASYVNINYALYQSGWQFAIYENGSNVGPVVDLTVGSVMRVERKGTAINYYLDGSLMYTSLTPSTSSLLLDISMGTPGGTMQNIRTSFVSPSSKILLAKNDYNELGQLVTKNLYNPDPATADDDTKFKQNVDYRYNIRGWLTNVNDAAAPTTNDLFGMELKYNDPSGNGGLAQFNGNISESVWRGIDGAINSYGYNYDAMNRLTTANYFNQANTTKNGRFNESIGEYDLNGNIKALTRNGKTGANAMGSFTYGTMDQLAYSNYKGNQLYKVDDSEAKAEGFRDGANTADDYAYDANGNMTTDLNKEIAISSPPAGGQVGAITYNHLNLPAKVSKANGDYVAYTYDATGRKLRQQVYKAGQTAPQKTTDYAGEFYYENDTLKFINHEEGRVIKKGSEASMAKNWSFDTDTENWVNNGHIANYTWANGTVQGDITGNDSHVTASFAGIPIDSKILVKIRMKVSRSVATTALA